MSARTTRVRPYTHSKMAQFLTMKIDSLKGEVSQREIAQRLGYDRPNIVSMFKTGEAKVPFEKIPALAEVLGVDVAHLVRLGLEQYWPERFDVIARLFPHMVTENEMELVRVTRAAASDSDPKLTAEQESQIQVLFSSR
jgi:transcriptional regulator with XRE-family HTH domain